jgi:hypothetical protein
MIQASTPMIISVLQAKAQALIFAVRLAKAMQFQQQTFLMDNSALAKAALANSITESQVPWEIRRHIAEFITFTKSSITSAYQIKIDLNGVAHNCAHQALRQSPSQPIFSCLNSAHKSLTYPILCRSTDAMSKCCNPCYKLLMTYELNKIWRLWSLSLCKKKCIFCYAVFNHVSFERKKCTI